MITAIHHVQITVPVGAEAKARRFYCDLLGLNEIPKPASLRSRGGLWLQVNDLQVHIGVEDAVDRQSTKAHLAYSVTNLAWWHKRLLEAGYTPKEGVPIPGYERFEFRDPFGNRIEMIEPQKS